MVFKAEFSYLGVDYCLPLNTDKIDRNYNDENYAYWVVEKNGRYFEINVWKDDNGNFTHRGKVYAFPDEGSFDDGDYARGEEFDITFSDYRRTVKVEVEIEYEYDPEHQDLVNFDEAYIDSVAKDMAIRPTKSIESGVRLIHVCNREDDSWWLINASK